MKLGLFMMPLHARGRGYGEMYDQDLAAILHADALGFDEAWVGEHYSAKVEPISNPLQFMSALIPQTRSITFGTGVLALAHHHPAKIAADVAMFDHMARGRLIMGIGPGGLPSDFELFGLDDPPMRGQRMLDCLDLVQRIWASDPPYDLQGRFNTVRIVESYAPDLDIGVMPKPYQPGGPPVFTSAMNPFSGMAGLAGERGWGLISANFNPTAHTATHWVRYEDGAAKSGRTADRAQWRIARSIVVADTDGEAQDYVSDTSSSVYDYYRYLRVQFQAAGLTPILKTEDVADEDVTDAYCVDSFVIAGSPATVADRLCDLVDKIGPFGGLLMAFHEWDDETVWRRSMELLAREVMPRVRERLVIPAEAASELRSPDSRP